jgi:uncharacterized PurR-regulated membrane protein YhhQ (DUF165 family)
MPKDAVGPAYLVALVLSVVVANWAVARFGVVPVGFGLSAPAAVYVVGVTFTLRDLAHERLGARWVLCAIVIGAALSALVSPTLALASGAAFLASEVGDLTVYAALRERGRLPALVASNAVGLVVDSVAFLLLAFGSLEFLAGQIVGKAWMTLLAVAVLVVARRPRLAPA